MPAKRSRSTTNDAEDTAQRAIVLQVLRPDLPQPWSRAEIEAELGDTPAVDVNDALERLHEQGVIEIHGEAVWASPAALHMDKLGLVSI